MFIFPDLTPDQIAELTASSVSFLALCWVFGTVATFINRS